MSTTRISGRRSAILPTLIIAAVLVVAFAIFTSFWTDRLWYRSMDFGTVFSTMLLTRIGLFVGFGLLKLSDTILLSLIANTVAQVAAMFMTIIKYLFPTK